MKLINEDGDIRDPYRSFISKSRYSRWLPEEGRRETWTETVDRYVDFMRDTPAGHQVSQPKWEEIRNSILNHEVMPSMRALMTAGKALERENLAQFNCSFAAVDDVRVFDEALYILMNGVGFGFSVEQKHVAKLPVVNEHFERSNTTVVVDDSKSGWARAYRELLSLLYSGQIPSIDITKVRPAGARLKTFGGRASGPQPLVDLFDFTIDIFENAAGRQLTPLECHDLMCKVGEVVVVGGVRRSALISLSDLSDYDMSKAKSGAWWEANGQRALSNNSAAYYQKPSIGEFLREWSNLYESKSGERGIVNMDLMKSKRFAPRRKTELLEGTNPCGEINLRSRGLCNLSEVVVKADDTEEDLVRKVEIATIIGTVQSTLTNFKYLRKIWKDNAEEERLLGVSLTGQMDHALLNGSAGFEELEKALTNMRTKAIDVNAKYAKAMGINQSAAITTGKPSGTVSQLTDSASGMHARHAEFYLRSVRADNKDPLTKFMKEIGVPNEPDVTKPDTTTVFYFPQKSPKDAKTRHDVSAIKHLNIWKAYKMHWTEHNPSITISVKEHEWLEVAQWVYENWEIVGGISFLPFTDHVYKQAPYQDCDESTYKQFVAESVNIDWSGLQGFEKEDNTDGSQTLACTGSSCELVNVGDS